MAVLKYGDKVYFGQPNPKSGTYIDHNDKIKRSNYIKRHTVKLMKNDFIMILKDLLHYLVLYCGAIKRI